MNAVIKGLLAGAVAWLVKSFRGLALDLVKVHAALWYLRAIRTARGLYLLGLASTLSVALTGAGFVLFHIGLFALLPAPANALVFLGLGLIYVVVGLGLVRALGSERRWLQASGADACAAAAGRRTQD